MKERVGMPYLLKITTNREEYLPGEMMVRESAIAKCLGAMYFLMQGTPFIYQGQEIGMTNVRYQSMEDTTTSPQKTSIKVNEKTAKDMKTLWR